MFDPETHPSVPTLRSTQAAQRRARSKARASLRDRKIFCPLPWQKNTRPFLLIRDGARGRTLSREAGRCRLYEYWRPAD